MRPRNSIFLLLGLLLPVVVSGSEPEACSLTIEITGVNPNTGQVIVSVFDSEATFLKEPLQESTVKVADSRKVTVSIPDLQPGTYAISVIYDENANNELDTGLFRIPKEKIGFSNNVKGRFGPPPFDDAAIAHPRDEPIRVQLGRARE